MNNPYYDVSFFQFIALFFTRVFSFFTGGLSYTDLAPDEIQILVLTGVAISSSLVGTFLIIKKMTMLANSLSHTILIGIVIAFVFGSTAEEMMEGAINVPLLLLASFGVALLTALTTEYLTKVGRIQEDASTGLVFTSFFAFGIVLVNLLAKNAHIGTEVVMGNVDALSFSDLKLVWIVFAITVFVFVLFFKEWQITSFDPVLASNLGFSAPLFNYLLMCLVSLTVVSAFRAVGVLMVLTFITAPPLMERLFFHRLSSILWAASLFSIVGVFLGVALSRHLLTVYNLPLSTGGLIVTLFGTVYLLITFTKNLYIKYS